MVSSRSVRDIMERQGLEVVGMFLGFLMDFHFLHAS